MCAGGAECGKYSHKLFLNPRSSCDTAQRRAHASGGHPSGHRAVKGWTLDNQVVTQVDNQADTQVVTRQSRGGQFSATSGQSTNSQRGTREQRAVRKLNLDTQEVDMCEKRRFKIIELN